jgi:hypothetical protein
MSAAHGAELTLPTQRRPWRFSGRTTGPLCEQRFAVLVCAFGPRTVRAVTHLDVTRAQCERAAAVLLDLLAT